MSKMCTIEQHHNITKRNKRHSSSSSSSGNSNDDDDDDDDTEPHNFKTPPQKRICLNNDFRMTQHEHTVEIAKILLIPRIFFALFNVVERPQRIMNQHSKHQYQSNHDYQMILNVACAIWPMACKIAHFLSPRYDESMEWLTGQPEHPLDFYVDEEEKNNCCCNPWFEYEIDGRACDVDKVYMFALVYETGLRSCERGDVTSLCILKKHFDCTSFNIHLNNNEMFRNACLFGHVRVAQWLMDTFFVFDDQCCYDDVCKCANECYTLALQHGHLNMVKWLCQHFVLNMDIV